MSQQKQSTTEQINNLIEFRQAIYENGLTDYRDAQFELIDALLANQRVNANEVGRALTWQSRRETRQQIGYKGV